MSMTERVSTRIDTALKKKALRVFDRLGLSEAEAIRLFYTQVELHQGIPFALRIPNAATQAAMAEASKPERLRSHKSFRDLRNQTGV